MALDTKLEVLNERLRNFTDKISQLEDKIDALDSKIDTINEIKIPSITDELSAYRAKAKIVGGIFGLFGSFIVGVALWAIEVLHR